MPEWYLVIIALAALSALGVLWPPLLLALPILALATAALAFESALGAARGSFRRAPRSSLNRYKLRSLTAFLYMLQPLARLSGRLRYGLAPWRRRSGPALALPISRTSSVWSESWQSSDERLRAVESALRCEGCTVLHGSAYDRWDLQVRGGLLGVARMRMAVEEHGGGKQFVRFHSWPKYSRLGLALIAFFAALSVGAALGGAWQASVALGALALVGAITVLQDCATAVGNLLQAIDRHSRGSEVEIRRERRAVAAPSAILNPAAGHESPNGHVFGSYSENGREGRTASPVELPSTRGVIPFSPEHD